MADLKVLVFSKDRPLQLAAYLESLLFCTGIQLCQLYIVIPGEDDYRPLLWTYARANWLAETWFNGFDRTWRYFVRCCLKESDCLLFGCDDVVYVRHVNLAAAVEYLSARREVLGFSLRLGLNIQQQPIGISPEDKLFYAWEWRHASSHWAYPFELMASMYRGQTIYEVMETAVSEMKCPNHLEAHGVTHCRQAGAAVGNVCAAFHSQSFAVAQDVNRVQNYFPNRVAGGEEHNPALLKDVYRRGGRLDWSALFGIAPPDPFVGAAYWRILDTPCARGT